MNDEQTPSRYSWLKRAKAQGWDATLSWVLDVAEPFAPLLAQLLWVGQPVMGVFGNRHIVDDLATAFDDPLEFATLRRLLDDDEPE